MVSARLDVDKLRVKGNVGGLIRALGSDDPLVRRKAVQALGGVGDASAVDPIVRCLVDPDKVVRESAARALGDIGDARALDSLLFCLQDQDPEVRWNAAKVLGKFGDAAVNPLIRLLDSVDKHVIEVSAFALGEIHDPRAVTPLLFALRRTDWEVRIRVDAAMQMIGEPSVGPLITFLKDGDAGNRCNAARALGRLGYRSAVDALMMCLDDENPDMRSCTAEALGQLGDPRAIESLAASLEDADISVRESAREAIAKLQAPA